MTDQPKPSAAALATADAICKKHGMLPGGFMRDSLAEALEDYARHQWNVTKPLDAAPVCRGCGGPHPFDTSIPSSTWNRVIRGAGLPDYLCTTCIVKAFVKAGEGFTAELYGEDFNGSIIVVALQETPAETCHELVDGFGYCPQPKPCKFHPPVGMMLGQPIWIDDLKRISEDGP